MLRNCYIETREDETGPIFLADEGGVHCNLDGYAIIPIERFHVLSGASDFCPEDHWPCNACGAKGPTAEGHDPCIANLPGVEQACCGHGFGHAYIKFENGPIIRGTFSPEAEPPNPSVPPADPQSPPPSH